ncbi:MAG TPA: SIR2 family protein [Conexibacter sp.]|nr:SIR2 family protein [Conexibacter sp.]
MVDHACAGLGFADSDLLRVRGTDLQILEFYSKRKGGIDELANWLTRQLDVPDDTLRDSAIHKGISGLSAVPLIYTTNYDELIERALALHGRTAEWVARERDLPKVLTRRQHGLDVCEVVKFHGDLRARETLVVTESEYEERLRLETPMDHRLRSDLLGRAVLFIGYSFRDPNVSYLFSLVERAFGELPEAQYGRRAFIAIPDPSEFERELFKQRNIDVIALDSGRLGEDTAELLSLVGEA